MGAMTLSPDDTDADAVLVVAADHPSLDRDVDRFVGALRAEPRFFGPSAAANPKPFPSLIAGLQAGDGFRLAAVDDGEIIGLARVAADGELLIAVRADRRAAGIGTVLGRAAVSRACDLGYGRIVIRASRRSRAVRRIGDQLGCVVVHRELGRTDLILDVQRGDTGERTA